MSIRRRIVEARRAAIERLCRGELNAVTLSGDVLIESTASVQTVLPGAFNPLHAGHRQMADQAESLVGASVAFELSIENVDKPPLEPGEIERRFAQFTPSQTICLTRAATFAEKVRLFGGVRFVVGADTILRIADPHYYAGSAARRDLALQAIAAAGATFLVFGRTLDSGFRTLGQLELPEPLRAICHEVGEADFRCDISSREIRRANSSKP